MHFRAEEVESFEAIWAESKHKIRAFEGVRSVQLLRDAHEPAVFYTLSYWENLDSLELYRRSDLFKSVWTKTRSLFQEPAKAFSMQAED